MVRYAMLVMLCLTLSLTACKKEEEAAEGAERTEEKAPAAGEEQAEAEKPKAEEPKAEEPKAEEEAGGALELGKLGLKAEGPSDAKVGDAVVGEGVMVQAPGLVVTVAGATDSNPETLEAAEKDAEMYSPENVKAEELEDGYTLTYENEGSMGKNYFVNVRRTIGDKTFWCSTTASEEKQQANALDFCKSLHQ
ncbi:MAG: hypothetical protein ACQEXJ_09260 [Myxococcota bacterium]